MPKYRLEEINQYKCQLVNVENEDFKFPIEYFDQDLKIFKVEWAGKLFDKSLYDVIEFKDEFFKPDSRIKGKQPSIQDFL